MIDSIRVAVTSRSFSKSPQLRAELEERFATVRFNETGRSLSGDDLAMFVGDTTHLIVALETVDEALLGGAPHLQVISKYGVGLDNIDLRACARHRVLVGWTGGVNRRSVAELTLCMAIGLLRQIRLAGELVATGGWRQIVGRQLSDCRFGILGCGHVGQDLARLLVPFGCEILIHDIRDRRPFAATVGARCVDLPTLLESVDILSVHTPRNASTLNLIDGPALARMRPGSYLLNLARGGIVDEAAVAGALHSGRLAGAAFDVLADEPPGQIELLEHPNVIITPHIGGSAAEAILAMGRAAIDGLTSAVDPLCHLQDELELEVS